ncbi:hypothetical protein XENOCAPTIV_022285 [Xenoophorus captivus]|uniref:BAH domain-containing protein n=1 Tax=Xenoophorus captivus TaxID=1517983 RepID=A0ABV0SA07_9TELE
MLPGETVKKKRGRKPKVVMGINPNRAHHRDRQDTHDVRENKTCSESSEHGELLLGSRTSDDSEEEAGDMKITLSSKEVPLNSAGTYPFSAQSSKLQANLKARSKRPGPPGLGNFPCIEQRSAPRRPHFSNLDRGNPDHMEANKASLASWGVPSLGCNFGDSHQALTEARRLIKDNERKASVKQGSRGKVLDVRPQTEAILTEGTRVCAYWSERSRCLYPGYVHRGAEPSPALLISPGHRGRKSSTAEKKDAPTEKLANEEVEGKPQGKRPVPKTANTSTSATDSVIKGKTSLLNWSIPRKRPPVDFFLFNWTSRKTQQKIRERDLGLFHRPALHSLAPPTPIKSIFGTAFEVDSFSSIANGYSTFGNGGASGSGRPVTTMGAMGLRESPCSSSVTMAAAAGSRKPLSERDRKHFLVKLDHEGVTSPKTKNGKALLRLGGVGGRGVKGQACAGALLQYTQPSLVVKNDKKVGEDKESVRRRSEILLKCVSPLRKDILSVDLGVKGGDYSLEYPSDCPSSYSELDEDDEDDSQKAEAQRRRAAVSSHRGGRFLSRPQNVNSSLQGPDRTTSNPASAPANGYITKAGVTIRGSKSMDVMTSSRKLFYKAIMRGKETVRVGDCAVFLSPGRPQLPYVGRVESLWESWSSSMVVRVKWFYHPEETRLGKRHRDGKVSARKSSYGLSLSSFHQNALYQSSHEDENDVQTISHRCQVVSKAEYDHLMRERKAGSPSNDLFYLAGSYEPTTGQLVSADGMVILS